MRRRPTHRIVDANVVSIAGAEVVGRGRTGDPWRATGSVRIQSAEDQLRVTSEEGWFEREQAKYL